MYHHCDGPQDVLHVMIHCDYPRVKKKGESSMAQYSKYARNYAEQSEGQPKRIHDIFRESTN